VEKVVEQSTVSQEKVTKIFINRKDTMAVFDINQLKGHGSSTFHRIFVSAGRAETTVTTEWNKFKLAAVRTSIHGTAKRWITTVDHLINVFRFRRSEMECTFDFFIVVSKDSL